MKKVIIALLMVAGTFGAMAQVTLNVLNYQQADQAGYQEDVQIW